MLKNRSVHRVIEPDTLQTDTGYFQGARRVELRSFVHVLWGGILAAGDGVLDNSL